MQADRPAIMTNPPASLSNLLTIINMSPTLTS